MRQRAAEQRGSVIVFVAVAMQVMLLMMAFAIEVGNWYVHQHQIQNRADNAAFAAALAYGYSFPACTETGGLDARDEIVPDCEAVRRRRRHPIA